MLPHMALTAGQCAVQRLSDQRARLLDAVKLDEGTEARPLRLAEQHLVERREPIAQRLEAVRLADGVDLALNALGKRALRQFGETPLELGERGTLLFVRRAIALRRLDEIVEVADRVADQLIEQGMLLRRRL